MSTSYPIAIATQLVMVIGVAMRTLSNRAMKISQNGHFENRKRTFLNSMILRFRSIGDFVNRNFLSKSRFYHSMTERLIAALDRNSRDQWSNALYIFRIHLLSLLLSLLLYEEIDPQCEAQRTVVRCWWVNLEQRWNYELDCAAFGRSKDSAKVGVVNGLRLGREGIE